VVFHIVCLTLTIWTHAHCHCSSKAGRHRSFYRDGKFHALEYFVERILIGLQGEMAARVVVRGRAANEQLLPAMDREIVLNVLDRMMT
jgi:hypothetical protein